jgi:hypothetical protein
MRVRVQSEAAAYSALSHCVLDARVPESIAADLSALTRIAVELKETMTALEGRLTKVALMRAQVRGVMPRFVIRLPIPCFPFARSEITLLVLLTLASCPSMSRRGRGCWNSRYLVLRALPVRRAALP